MRRATIALWLMAAACGASATQAVHAQPKAAKALPAQPAVAQPKGAKAQPPLPVLRGEHLVRPQSVEAAALEALPARIAKERIATLQLAAAPRTGDAARRVVEAVRSGAIDLAVVPLAALGPQAPRFRVFEIPFLFEDSGHAVAVQFARELGLLEAVRAAGVEGIGWWPGETLVLASRKPVLEPPDMTGLRTATRSLPETSEASALRLLGEKARAVPVAPPAAEVFAALQAGAVDVVEAPLTDLHRQQPGGTRLAITLTDHLYAGYVIVANAGRWNALPAATRERLRDELRFAHDDVRWTVHGAARVARQDMARERRATFVELPSSVRRRWRDALRSESLAGPAGFDFVEAVERFSDRTLAAAARGGGPSISWNGWFEAGPENAPQDVDALELDGVYRFYLDIARYPYVERLSARLGMPIEKLLEGKGERTLLLQPVLLGSGLEAAPGRPLGPQRMTVKLARASAGPRDEQLLESFDKKQLTTRALSREVNLGGLASWDLKASAVGCGGIAVTVWDDARVKPLDHIVLRVPVRAAGQGPKECGWDDSAKAMNAGLLTLLAGPAAPAGGRVADAALHVFESKEGGKVRSHAVFIHRARLSAALADPQAGDPGVYAWQLASVLSDYVSQPSQLPELVKGAHKAIGLGAARPFPYEDVAFELALKIFGGASQRDQDEAAKARAALQAVVASAPQPAVVVRLVAAGGDTLFVPFGLLAAQGKTPVVAKRFTVIQPLPQPRPIAAACIDAWRVARPRELQGVSGEARDLLRKAAEAPPPAGISVLDSHGTLAEYLLAEGEAGAANRASGLIVLAHHDQGYLKFSDADRPPARIAHEFIRRRFPPGSAAVLAACTTVGDAAETRSIVERFSRQGVDALIVSPFLVDAEFGTRLALEFEHVVADARAKGGGATLLELFERTTAKVAEAYKNQAALRDMALEFMLIGNPELRLCQ